MKKLLYILSVALVIFASGCSDDHENLPHKTPEATGTFTDTDGTEYKWVRYNGLDWMTSNYKGGSPYYESTDYWGDDLIYFEDKDLSISDFEIFGNMYTYDEANTLAPEGWRLPTDEDWQKLEQAMGMSAQTADTRGWRGAGVGTLLQQDESGTGINLLLGGIVCNRAGRPESFMLRHVRAYGYYWTADLDSTYTAERMAYYRRIRYNSTEIEREVTGIEVYDYWGDLYPTYMSVRYVRDAQ
ncbi:MULTISPECIES: FISUMP domain-containing protein [Butyricimonas]|uniref:FISUMP domain-containing protein n=1 Tax=Butyricimonas TaxID=574697 RepID=UPI0007FB3704|nr:MULTISPECIES: FISUMP domain-containing protein [Butyricimonas]